MGVQAPAGHHTVALQSMEPQLLIPLGCDFTLQAAVPAPHPIQGDAGGTLEMVHAQALVLPAQWLQLTCMWLGKPGPAHSVDTHVMAPQRGTVGWKSLLSPFPFSGVCGSAFLTVVFLHPSAILPHPRDGASILTVLWVCQPWSPACSSSPACSGHSVLAAFVLCGFPGEC